MPKRFFAWISLSALVITLDQITKLAVLSHLSLGEGIPYTDFFKLVLVYNPGAAFSFLSDQDGWQKWFFATLAIGVSGWLLVLLRQHAAERLQPLAFSLVIGGALGNLIDRIAYGAVVDFLYFHIGHLGWPAFNLADSAICLGVALLVFAQLRTPKSNPAVHG